MELCDVIRFNKPITMTTARDAVTCSALTDAPKLTGESGSGSVLRLRPLALDHTVKIILTIIFTY